MAKKSLRVLKFKNQSFQNHPILPLQLPVVLVYSALVLVRSKTLGVAVHEHHSILIITGSKK
jgi:hypothetical protein